MSETNPAPQGIVTELQVSAHLMQLDAGVYCVYHSPGSLPPDAATGLPAARLSLPPGRTSSDVMITGFRDDGWLGSLDSAALIRVTHGPAQILMTIYQTAGANQPPRLQVTKLVEGISGALAPDAGAQLPSRNGKTADPATQIENPEIAAHIQRRGDILARIGEWVGERSSKQWIEGFALAPTVSGIALEDIEYQAVLGRGWLSPWSEGSQYCGSRGMALPILGLRVRLRGKAETTHTIKLSGTFTDGTEIGPVAAGEACEAESLAPLEAFLVQIIPISKGGAVTSPASPAATGGRAKASTKAKPVPPSARGRSK